MDFSRLTPYPGDAKSGQLALNARDDVSVFIERYSELRAVGRERDVAIGVLRKEGATFLFCIVALYRVDGLSLGDAKAAVHNSPALSDGVEDREAFWNAVYKTIEEMADSRA